MKIINNKNIFITGGTGSFGQALTKNLIKNHKPKKIIIYSRDELKQYEMKKFLYEKFSNDKLKKIELRFFIGDVRDADRTTMAMKNIDFVFHAAAMKHVDIAEYNPFEAVKTNIIGAQNIINSAISNKVQKVIALSTDKASAPINLYGATKLASDKLFLAANNYIGDHKTKFSVVRYGNVFGSRGSILPFFLNIPKDKPFTVTDKGMTRFSIMLDQGVAFVLDSLKEMNGSELFVPKIPSYRIMDLVKAIDPKRKVQFIGIKPGEKLHESMITSDDSPSTIEFRDKFIIFPNLSIRNKAAYIINNKSKGAKACIEGFNYTSGQNRFLKINEIKNLIKEFKKNKF